MVLTPLFEITILLFPILTFIFLGNYGKALGLSGSIIISLINIISITLIVWFKLSINIIFNFKKYINIHDWLYINNLPISFNFAFDNLTLIMFLVVTTVSCCVHIYSTIYMYTDPALIKFLSYLSLFSFFMLILVSAGNYLVLFVGWEGVGLSSYLLVGFWSTRAQAGKAATKAFLVNKVGDLFFLYSISAIFIMFYCIDFSFLYNVAGYQNSELIEIINIGLFIGAVGKSAQIGLHTWLPDAMEGPTPVSALIHAATMVTAGIFLIIRSAQIFEYSYKYLYILAIWGSVTSFIAGSIGAVQNDIKKIIAYSTCSQLGFMLTSCGFSEYSVALFHLFNHAFFKALLFLSAGSIIHLMSNEQDIEKFGSLSRVTPTIYIYLFLASLALAGFPFLSGFYSKDIIIESGLIKYWVNGQLFYILSLISAGLSSVYSLKILDEVFWESYNGFKKTILNYSKVTLIERLVLLPLLVLSLLSGYLFKDIFISTGYSYITERLMTMYSIIELEFISSFVKLIPLCAIIFGEDENDFISEYKWYFNELINNYFVITSLILSKHSFEQYEKNVLEACGPLFIWKQYLNIFYIKPTHITNRDDINN